MPKINVDDVVVGMTLAEDLVTDQGRFLLGKGTVLQEQHMRVLKIWGVLVLEVEGEEPAPAEPKEIPDEYLQRAQEAVHSRFRLNDLKFPVIDELAKICTHRLATRMVHGHDLPAAKKSKGQAGEVDLEALAEKFQATVDEVWSDKDESLATMPGNLSELVSTINNPRCSALEIARVVERDPALTAKLLRIVNSPFYGFPSKIDTISRAVAIIGSRQLTTLAVGIACITHFSGIPTDLVNMRTFWRHSLLVGFGSRLLATYMNTPNSERFFVAGLLHDIGRLALYRLRPAASAAILHAADALRECNHRVERKIMGFEHGVLGSMMLKEWLFPVMLENAVGDHHSPMTSPNFREAAVVHFADVLAWALDEEAGMHVVPQVNALAWESLGLSAFSLPSMVEQLDYLFTQTAGLFLGEDG